MSLKDYHKLVPRQHIGQIIYPRQKYDLLEKYWDSTTYSSDFKENQDKIRAKKMISNFVVWAKKNPHKVIGVELPFQLKLSGIPIRGKIDRLEQDENGNYYVVDYKTGKCYETDSSISENIQMNLYALAIEEKFKKLPLQSSLYYVDDDKMIKNVISDRRSVDDFKLKLEGVITSILNEEFEANPLQGAWTCRWCSYKNICDEAQKHSMEIIENSITRREGRGRRERGLTPKHSAQHCRNGVR